VPGERTREVTLDPGASADTPARRQGPGGSLPRLDAGHPLQGAGRLATGRACGGLTATGTAIAATNRDRQRPATAHNAREIRSNLGYVRPEKRTVGTDTASAVTVANTAAKPPDNA
jgi:hypothetical protein